MGKPVSIPTLKTLKTKPSWHNRAGRVDRAACFVMSVNKHWREIPEDDWTYRIKQPRCGASQDQRRVASRLKGLCDRYAEVTFWARDLWLLHKGEMPYPLQGDFRTAKSNAMKAGEGAQWVRKDAILGDGPTNPNRGVGFNQYKMLGLDAMWSSTLRIERIVQHEKLRQHFFVYSVCADNRHNETASGRRPPGYPPGQTRSPGERRSPAIVTKLYLPLCTPHEWQDARIAQLWLQSHPQIVTHPNRPLPPEVIQVLSRYGELFEPRQLRCRQCLGLRYGEVKAKSRPLSPRERTGVRGKRQRIQSEQTLFLTNLPKLLAPVPDDLPPLPTGEDTGEGSAEGRMKIATMPSLGSADSSPQPSPGGRGGKTTTAPPAKRIADLSQADKEKLYLLFANRLIRARSVSE